MTKTESLVNVRAMDSETSYIRSSDDQGVKAEDTAASLVSVTLVMMTLKCDTDSEQHHSDTNTPRMLSSQTQQIDQLHRSSPCRLLSITSRSPLTVKRSWHYSGRYISVIDYKLSKLD